MKSINPEPDPSRAIQSMCTELAVWPYSCLHIHSTDFIQAGCSSLCKTVVVDSMCQCGWPKGCSDSWGHVVYGCVSDGVSEEMSTGLPGPSKEIALISAAQGHHPTWWGQWNTKVKEKQIISS